MPLVDEYISNLTSIFNSYIGGTTSGNFANLDLRGIQNCLNQIFSGKVCTNVLLTRNSDKMFFGVQLNPTIMADDFLNILFGDDGFIVNRYAVELDSKLFSVGMDGEEIVAYLLFEISSLTYDSGPTWEVRKLIDYHMAEEDDIIDIKQSVNYSQVLIFAIKDALCKMSSIRYKDTDGILSNEFINSSEELRDSLIDGVNKIRSSVFGVGAVVKEPNLVLLSWAFRIYKEAKLCAKDSIHYLLDAKEITASKLIKDEIDKVIKSLQRLNFDITNEGAKLLQEGKGGVFAGLKKSGLRSIEDDLYEYSVRVKNAETEEDVYFTLRAINTRINILEEYIYDNDLPDREKERWRKVAQSYRDLRSQLATRKFSKKQYGLWYDYEKLDDLD